MIFPTPCEHNYPLPSISAHPSLHQQQKKKPLFHHNTVSEHFRQSSIAKRTYSPRKFDISHQMDSAARALSEQTQLHAASSLHDTSCGLSYSYYCIFPVFWFPHPQTRLARIVHQYLRSVD